MAKRAEHFFEPAGQTPQTTAQGFVIVAAQRVARDIGRCGVLQLRNAVGHWLRQVIAADRNNRERARHQSRRPTPFAVVGGQPRHLAVVVAGEPILQTGLVGAQIDAGDADLLKAEFGAPVSQQRDQRLRVRCHP
jgi:hypothetical protein